MNANAIVPDDKDWTWVLERACPECGADVSAMPAADVAGLIRANADEWVTVLDAAGDDARVRQHPDRWSTLEYAAHVRDVHRLYLVRLTMMRTEHDPLFPNWDQDETAIVERYGEQDPATVSAELVAAAGALAAAFDEVSGDEWERPGRRSDGASFTIESFARYLVHDPLHHLWDVSAST